MATGSIITQSGKNIMLYRGWTANGSLSSTQYLVPTKFSIGVSNSTPSITDTDLDIKVPISVGTCNDNGANTLTGSSGGDNSTSNTTTYKEGAGQTDNTSQNLIANATNASKIWTIANLSTLGTNITGTQPFGLWLYIKDSTTLDKFLTSGTALEIRLGSDTSNYYSYTRTAAQLATGWNWITSNLVNVEDLTETGTVTGNIDTFQIIITTNNATDTFVAGDVIYDLLRQWQESDLYKTFVSGYPTLNLTNNEITIKCFLGSTEANGFLLNSLGIWNEDTTKLMASIDVFNNESKSKTDEFTFTIKNRIL